VEFLPRFELVQGNGVIPASGFETGIHASILVPHFLQQFESQQIPVEPQRGADIAGVNHGVIERERGHLAGNSPTETSSAPTHGDFSGEPGGTRTLQRVHSMYLAGFRFAVTCL
jgi:hypothetical protein